jgi:uncharacterized protein (TIGR02588 family)
MSTAIASEPKTQAGAHEEPRSTAEWLSLIISLLILLGIIGLVLAMWANSASAPAQFTLEPGDVRQANGLYYLPVTIANTGDETAAQVMLEGIVTAGEDEEEATTTIDFLPGHAQAEAVLIFSHDPSDAELRVVSYQKP